MEMQFEKEERKRERGKITQVLKDSRDGSLGKMKKQRRESCEERMQEGHRG